MNTFYTQHIYVLYQNENEYTRFKNYIEKYKIKLDYEMIKSVPVVLDENLNNKKNLNSTCKYLNNYMKRYINYKLNPKQISHIKSIKKIINNAIINNYDSITILEYDVLFHKNFSDLLPNYKNLINNSDIIYLGSSQSSWYNPITLEKIEYHSNYYTANHSLGTFAIILKKQVFKKYIEYLDAFLFSSDIVLSIISKYYKSIVIYPNLIICDVTKSTILEDRDEMKTFIKFKWDKKIYMT